MTKRTRNDLSKPEAPSTHPMVRVPPHSNEAEQAVLGSLMLDNQAWDKIADKLSGTDFYQSNHRLVYEAISELSRQKKPFDVLTLSDLLKKKQKLEEVGGEVFLFELAKNTPTAANVSTYADMVRERSILRQLITISHEIADHALAPNNQPVLDLLDEAEQKIFRIAEQNSRGADARSIGSLLAYAVNRIDEVFHSDSPISGLETGYTDFDAMTCGLQSSELIILAGRPSMGKTAFALNIAEHITLKIKKPVLIFSMEMSAESLAMRLLSSLGHIDSHNLRTGQLTDEDLARVDHAVGLISDAPLFIDDTAALSPAELRARARRVYKQQGELGCIIIDYLQLMQVPNNKENRATEISEISRNLKSLAKELNVPVIALSQLNRGLEQRTDKRPVMSDLRESGALEQDADLIVFIYRDEVYNEDSLHKGTAEIIIGKQRNGPIGRTKLTFLGKYTRFANFSQDNYQPE
jgi:replicative DNA helicase